MTTRRILMAALIGWLGAGVGAGAAEITIRGECETNGAVVKLADVAQVVSTDPAEVERLASIELFPTPADGRPRFVGQREIQDILMARGVHLGQHQFAGASQTAVRRAVDGKATPAAALAPTLQRRIERRVSDAIVEHLRLVAGNEPWTADVTLTAEQSRLMSGVKHTISVSGGNEPWLGVQRLDVRVSRPGMPAEEFTVDARVSLPAAMVVATRDLRRGETIGPADVRLERLNPVVPVEGGLSTLQEAVGQETTVTIPVGKPLLAASVRSPLLVRRGEIITVTAASGGVRVTTNARARDDGSKGDLIAVESLHDRKAFFAKVNSLREVEVFAGVVRAVSADDATATAANTRNRSSSRRAK